MATRDVQLRLSATGLDKLVAQFDALGKKLDTIISRLDDISRKMDVLGAKKASPTVTLEGADKALAQVALLKAALDDLGNSKTSAGVRGDAQSALSKFMYNSLYRPDTGGSPFTAGMSGEIQRMLARDRVYGGLGTGGGFESLFRSPGAFTAGHMGILRGMLGRESALSGENIDRGMFDLLGRWGRLGSLGGLFGAGGFFGAGGGLMRGAGAVSGAASSAGSAIGKVPWAPIGIGGGIGLLASMTPALVPTLIGALTGGGAAFGAFHMASTANTNLQALQSTLQSAQQTYQQDIATGASSQQTAYDRLQMVQAQQAVTQFQKQNAPALNLYSKGQNLASDAASLFSGAIMANATKSIDTSKGIKQVPVGGTSFMSGIGKITDQVGSYVKTVGVNNLASTFQASLPFIQLVVHSLEDFANVMGPVVTKSMQMFRPYLPIMRQGFKELSLGIADFIKYLGPGMKGGAEIFKATMVVVRGALIAVSVLMSTAAQVVYGVGHAFTIASNTIQDAVKAAWHWVQNTFDQIVQGAKDIIPTLEALGKQIIQGLINGIKSMGPAVLHAITGLAGMIPHALASVLHILSPSRVMFGLGEHIGEGLALGIDSKQGRVMSSAANLARGIPGAIGSGAGAGGARGVIPLSIELRLNDQLMQVISKQIRVMGGDPRILIRKVQVI